MQKILFNLLVGFVIFFHFIEAKEVVDGQINKDLGVISVATFNKEANAKKMVNTFNEKYDIYTRFQNGKYYQFLVNIEPSLKDEALQDAKNFASDAYFIKKEDFDYGVVLFEMKENTTNEYHEDNNQTKEIEPQNNELDLIRQYTSPQTDMKKEQQKIEKSTIEQAMVDQEYEVDGAIKVDLIDAVLQTLSRSHRIQAAREKLIQAKRDIDIAYAGYKPTVEAGYSVSKNRREPGEEDANGQRQNKKEYDDERLTLKIDQNLYAGGGTRANVKKVKMDYLIAKNIYQGLIETEVLKAVNAYFDIVFRREALQVNEKNIEQLQNIFELVKAKFESGALSRGELSNTEASVANAMSQLTQTESQYNNALEYYQYIAGKMFSDTYPYQKEVDIQIDDFETVKKKALVDNNKLKGLSYTIASKKYSLKMAKASFRPELDFQLSAEKIMDKEDHEVDEKEYMARFSIKYNLYNGGSDKASYLKAYSSIRETRYEKEADAREILWNLEKMHTSLMSLEESIESVKTEVVSSQNTVDSYWEAFRLGEQDLYILLEAQRQLNTAQLDLIDAQLGSITNFFKILQISGSLISYFDLDLDNDNFLDMARGRYQQRLRAIEQNKQAEAEATALKAPKEAIAQNENGSITKEELNEDNVTSNYQFTIEDLLSFSEMFLIENPENYTVVFEGFENIYDTLRFINDTNIQEKVFIYRTLQDEKVITNLAYEVFENKQDGQIALEQEKFRDFTPKKVSSVGDVQKMWANFNETKLMEKKEIAPIIVEKEVSPPPFETNEAFKRSFLDADPNLFTINVTTLQTIDDAAQIVNSQEIAENSFIFEYGEDEQFVKLMYGVYDTYKEAQQGLNSLGAIKSRYIPVIEKIGLKQALYKRYNQ